MKQGVSILRDYGLTGRDQAREGPCRPSRMRPQRSPALTRLDLPSPPDGANYGEMQGLAPDFPKSG